MLSRRETLASMMAMPLATLPIPAVADSDYVRLRELSAMLLYAVPLSDLGLIHATAMRRHVLSLPSLTGPGWRERAGERLRGIKRAATLAASSDNYYDVVPDIADKTTGACLRLDSRLQRVENWLV